MANGADDKGAEMTKSVKFIQGGEVKQFGVGDGATEIWWSDRVAGTIISVSPNGKAVVWQEDEAIRTDSHGMSDSQSYRYERDPGGRIRTYTLRKNGRWVEQGQPMNSRYIITGRHAYYDFSF